MRRRMDDQNTRKKWFVWCRTTQHKETIIAVARSHEYCTFCLTFPWAFLTIPSSSLSLDILVAHMKFARLARLELRQRESLRRGLRHTPFFKIFVDGLEASIETTYFWAAQSALRLWLNPTLHFWLEDGQLEKCKSKSLNVYIPQSSLVSQNFEFTRKPHYSLKLLSCKFQQAHHKEGNQVSRQFIYLKTKEPSNLAVCNKFKAWNKSESEMHSRRPQGRGILDHFLQGLAPGKSWSAKTEDR